MKQYTRYKNLFTLIISLGIILILLLVAPILQVVNKSLYEGYFSIKNTIFWNTATPEIVLVYIDDTSLESIWSFPFARSNYTQALENLQSFNPAVIAFDILFLDSSPDKNDDEIFVNALEQYGNLVFGSAITSAGLVETPFFRSDNGYLPPRVDASNNTVYSFFPAYRDTKGIYYEHFTLEILRKYYYHFSEDRNILEKWNYAAGAYNFSDKISYPLSYRWSDDILINFSPWDNFKRISFSDTLDIKKLEELSLDFTDAIILIAPAAEGFGDYFYTPNGREYGVNIHAHILSTLLSKQYITYFDFLHEWALIFFLIILSVYTNLSSSKLALIGGNIAIILIFWLLIPLILLGISNIILYHPAEIIFSLILAFTSANIVKYILENMNKKRLNMALSEYVGSSIADEILLEHWKVNLDGEKREVVCFFSDIEGFTSLSESLDPESLVAFLRAYLSEMTNITMEKWGHIDKFEWDAIMALWGAFSTYSSEDCIRACETALVQQEAIIWISKKYKKLISSDLHVRIGIHEGDVIIWNIWAIGKKMEFTALGDNVNLASRLESVNKHYGTYICVSHPIHEATKDIFAYRFLDEIRVQGKNNAVKIYELLGHKKDLSEEKFEHYMKFSRALGQYRKWNFVEAAKIFKPLSLAWDKPSKVFLIRCHDFEQKPPQDWDGVWNMQEK